MIESVTGVILAGGKSTRMGQNKALLPFQGSTLIESVVRTLSTIFSRIVLSVQADNVFPNLSIPKVVDRYTETGPLGGITSVLETGEARIFCVACDMPFLNPTLIEHLCHFPVYDAVIPFWKGKVEVLHAVYSNALLPALQASLGAGRFRITDALGEAHVRYVQEEEIKQFDLEGKSFSNVNTPDEYKQIQ